MPGWTREQIEGRVAELREENEGRDFVSAVAAWGADELDEGERKVLGDVLLERAQETGGFDVADRRLQEGGWTRRALRRLDESLEALDPRNRPKR
jgi:hypothetical protein